MGRSKQLLEIEGGHLLLKTTQQAIDSEGEKVTVVLGANELAHRKSIEHLAIEIVTNEEWQQGMGGSLKKGLQKLLQLLPEMDAALVMVCDQPLLTTSHLNKLIHTFQQTKRPIIASYYSGTEGVPALFEKSLFKEMLILQNEAGAKKIIQQHRESVHVIDFPEGAVDLDTPDDYQKFINRKN